MAQTFPMNYRYNAEYNDSLYGSPTPSATAYDDEDDMVMGYYDPRYSQFFYAGLLPPPTGDPELEAIYASSSIEVYPEEPPLERPILVTPERRGSRRKSWTRHVWWHPYLPRRHTESPFRSLACLMCVAIVLFVVVILVLYWLGRYIDEQAETVSEFEEAQSDEGIVVRPYYTHTTTPKEILATRSLANGTLSSRASPVRQPLSVAHNKDDVGLFRNRSNICDVYSPGAALRYLSGNEPHTRTLLSCCCDIAIFCYYATQGQLASRSAKNANSVCGLRDFRPLRAACHDDRRPQVLLGVNIGGTSSETLVNGSIEDAPSLLGDAGLLAKRSGFDGVALWWRNDAKPGVEEIVNAARAVTTKLTQGNFALSIFIPYLVRRRRPNSETLPGLNDQLNTSLYSVVFYPHVLMFGRKTSWPLPEHVAADIADELVEKYTSVCYLFTTASFIVRLKKRCDPGKVQDTVAPPQPTSPDAEDTCRSLWGHSAKVARHRYYTYRCRGRSGILYQSAVQAAKFRHDLLSLAGTSCYGTISGWEPDQSSVCINISRPSV